ncbi:hypothetical protein Tco_1469536, partial [Tanacetum coccineum]
TRVTQSNHFVPQVVLLRSGKVFIPAARPNQVPASRPKLVSIGRPTPVSTGRPKPVSTGRPKPVSTGRPKPVSTGRPKPVSTGRPKLVSTGKQNRLPPVHAARRNSSSVTSVNLHTDANEKKLIQVLKIHTDDNVADLLTKAFDGPRRPYFDDNEFLVVDRHDLLKLYGLVVKYYENHPVAGAGLVLWGDLQVLIDSQEG